MINLKRRNKRVRWVPCVTGAHFDFGSRRLQSRRGQSLPRPEGRLPAVATRDRCRYACAGNGDTGHRSTPASSPPTAMAPPMSLPQLKYHVPEGWKEKPPSEMRVASFAALGPKGQSADVSVIPMPIVGRDLELVNMWRSQVQLPATSDPGRRQAGRTGRHRRETRAACLNSSATQPMIGKSRQRMLVAMCTRGDDELVFQNERRG